MTTTGGIPNTLNTFKISGLSGIRTEEIVSALMSIERRPVTRMGQEVTVRSDEETALRKLQSSLQELASSASELALPTLFEQHQSATSSEPSRVSATVTGGAAVGGYEVSVSELATAAQRTFAYAVPGSAQTLAINGKEVALSAGETLSQFAAALNNNSQVSVYASVVNETLVLSSRETGSLAKVEVSDPGGALTETAGTYKGGKNAEYTINGEAGSASSNTLTTAIPGVTLTLAAITGSGPVTINVTPPAISAEKVTAAVKGFVSRYNAALAAVQSEMATKPAAGLTAEAEHGTGTLFGDPELAGLSTAMRQAIYTPVSGLPSSMASPEDVGVTSGAPTANPSQASVEGQLTLNEATLEAALKAEPENVRKMLEGWSASFQKQIEGSSAPGGTLEARLHVDEAQTTYINEQITSLNASLTVRQQSLEREYTELETAVRRAQAQSSFVKAQLGVASSSGSEGTLL